LELAKQTILQKMERQSLIPEMTGYFKNAKGAEYLILHLKQLILFLILKY